MLNLKQAISSDIAAGIEAAREVGEIKFNGKAPEVVVSLADGEERGHYASPIALALAKRAGMEPMKVVQAIAAQMPKKSYIGRLKGAKPGFLNIWLNVGWLTARLDNVLEEPLCGSVGIGEGKSVNLEFISANPTGPLTLGNARTAFSVDTLGRVLECAGYDVTREYYFNDAGGQVDRLGESVVRRILQAKGREVEYPAEMYQGDYVAGIGTLVAEKFREEDGKEFGEDDLFDNAWLRKAGEEAARILMVKIKSMIREDLKINFDVWTSESELRESGKIETVLDRLEKVGDVFERDGAKWFRTTKYGDSEDRIVVKSDGELAYIAPDIGYHQDKYDRGFDQIVTVVGADHQGHLSKVKAAMEALGNDPAKLHLIAAQWLRFVKDGKPVKLSKRAGQIVTPRDLIDEIGYDAARFFMVQHSLTTHMELDLGLAKERSERNPVYYVQYAYVRLQSILRQAKQRGLMAEIGMKMVMSDNPGLTHTLELALIRQMYRWPEVVADIADSLEVQQLTYYASELARAVHVWYRHVPVLAAGDERLLKARLQLTLTARKVLGETLDLLGISKPDVM